MAEVRRTIGIIGGTGQEGMGLATRWAAAGYPVVLGSREEQRAAASAEKVRAAVPKAAVTGALNADAAHQGQIIVVTVPYEGQAGTLSMLRPETAGKTVLSTVVPLRFTQGTPGIIEVPEGSAAQQAAALLPRARVAAAFHHLSAPKLLDLKAGLGADVIICGDDLAAKADAMELAGAIGDCHGVDGGGLAMARYVEAFTAVLVTINRLHRARSSIRVVGI